MQFEPAAEHLAIGEMAARFLSTHWDINMRRKALDDPPVSVPDDAWGHIVQAGWLGINARESVGGAEQDAIAAAVLVETAAQFLFPNTLITGLVAAFALDQASGEQSELEALERALIEGRKFVSVAMEDHPPTQPDAIRGAHVSGPFKDGRSTISGSKFMVPDLDRADAVLVSCLFDGEPILIRLSSDAPGLDWKPLVRIDGQSYFELTLEDVQFHQRDILGGEKAEAVALEGRVRKYWMLLLAADLLGLTNCLLTRTVEYCRERVQFGRPIGSFQAVSHRLAGIKVDEEIGRSLLYGASVALQSDADGAGPYIAAAKAWLSEAAVKAGEASIQLHGGIGYTWELDVHLFLRQARCNAVQMGDARFHRGLIAGHILDDGGS